MNKLPIGSIFYSWIDRTEHKDHTTVRMKPLCRYKTVSPKSPTAYFQLFDYSMHMRCILLNSYLNIFKCGVPLVATI